MSERLIPNEPGWWDYRDKEGEVHRVLVTERDSCLVCYSKGSYRFTFSDRFAFPEWISGPHEKSEQSSRQLALDALSQALRSFDVPEVHQPERDAVNHPSHYTSHPSGIECIEITRHHDFAVGNAIKYLWRAGLKDSADQLEDLKKARWYIDDKINQLEPKQPEQP